MNSDVGGRLRYIIQADIGDFTQTLTTAGKAFDKVASEMEESGAEAGAAAGKALSTGISEGTENATRSVTKFTSNALTDLSQFSASALKVAENAFSTIATLGIGTFTSWSKAGIADTQFLESTQIQMQGLTHSLEAGRKAMAITTKYYKNNPFSRFDVSSATKNLIQYGATLEELPTLLEKMGNVSLSTGAGIDELATVYQKTVSQGKVGLEDIYMLVNRGVPIWDAFSKACGKSADEVREMTRRGTLDVATFKQAFDYLIDEQAMKENEKTLARQLDRFKGRLSNMKAALAGYSMDMEKGLQIDEDGLYKAYVGLLKKFADTMDSEVGKKLYAALGKLAKAVAPYIDKLANALPTILGKLADVIGYIADHSETLIPIIGGVLSLFGKLGGNIPIVGGLIDSLTGPFGKMIKVFGRANAIGDVLILTVFGGIIKAFKDGQLTGAIESIIQSVIQIGKVVLPVIKNILNVIASIGEVAVVAIVKALAKALEFLANVITAIPEPVLTAIVGALMGFLALKNFGPVAKGIAGGLKVIGAVPSKPLEKVGTSLGKFIVGAFKALGSNIGDIALGAGALLLIGGAIGGFIAAIGGGIWVFGKGLESVGAGFKELATGIQELNKVDADRIPEVIGKLGEALSGLFWKAFDFATAASTFYGIGIGLQEIAKGMIVMRDVRTKDFEKLQPLAEGLQHFCYTTINLPWLKTENTLSYFKDLGDAIKNVADLCNLVADLKVDNKRLTESMKAIAEGLRSFLIVELRPSWFEKVFSHDIEVKSVTDYMGSLGSVIAPLNEFQKLVSSYNFDSAKFSQALQDIAAALKSFLIVEVKPSWINKVFGNYSEINIKAVTDYLGSLGSVIDPLNHLNEMMKDADFKADEFTTFLTNLGTSLQAFLTYDFEQKVSGFWGLIEGTEKYETKAVLDYFDKFSSVITALKEIQPLAKDADDLKASDFVTFVQNIGESLQAFLTYNIESTYSQFLGVNKSYKQTAVGILDFMDNLKPVVEGLTKLSELAKSYEKDLDRDNFVNFVKAIGESLRAFTVYDIEDSYSEFLGVTKTMKRTAKTLLDGFQNFGTLVQGLSDMSKLYKEFGGDIDPDDFTDFLTNIGKSLQAFNYFDTEYKSGGWGFESYYKIETKSLLTSLSNFADLGKGLQEIGKVFKDTELKPDDYTDFLTSLGEVLKASTFTSKENAKSSTWFSSAEVTNEYDSIFNHLAHFKEFAEGVGSILAIPELGAAKVLQIKRFISDLTKTLDETVRIFSVENDKENGGIGYSNKKHYKAEYDSIFNHLGNFKDFADSLQTLLTIQDIGDDKIQGLKGFIVDLAKTLNDSVFITGDEYEHTFDKFMDTSETTKYNTQYDSIYNHLSGFSSFANSIGTLLEISNTITGDQLANLKQFVSDLATALFDSLFESHSEESAEASALWGIASAKTSATSEYSTVLDHMQNFDKFANGIVTIMNAISSVNFDKDKFISTIQAIFEALGALSLEETETTKENGGGLFGIGSSKETTSVNYTSIMEYLGDIEKIANVISRLVNEVGVGVAGGAIGNGATFKTAMTNIAAGMKQVGDDWGEVSWENIDTDVLNRINEFIEKFKTITTGWDTSNLTTQANDLSTFISTFVTAFQDSDKIATVVENAEKLGAQLADTIAKGLESKQEEFTGKVQGFLSTGIPTGFQNSEQTITASTQADIMDKIFRQLEDGGNMETLRGIGKKIVEALRDGFAKGYDALHNGVTGIVEAISQKFYEYTNPNGRFDAIGGYIIDGLNRGMNNKKQSVINTANSLANIIATTIEYAQRVSSPSKRMFKIGEYIGEGLVLGLESQIESVGDAAQELADAIRTPMAGLNDMNVALTAGDGTSGNTWNKNLTVNQNNIINSDLDYGSMMADLKWELFTA